VGQINFTDIVSYDINGDEFYSCPHFFCRFKFNGTPFENIYYSSLENLYDRFELKDKRK